MSGAFMECVDVFGVPVVRCADGLGEGIVVAGDCDYMDMVCHEATGEELEAVFVGLVFEMVEIDAAIVVDEKDVLAIVASLGYVMGITCRDCSC